MLLPRNHGPPLWDSVGHIGNFAHVQFVALQLIVIKYFLWQFNLWIYYVEINQILLLLLLWYRSRIFFRKSSLIQNTNNFIKDDFSNWIWKRNWFCHLLLYFKSIVEFYFGFICGKPVKNKYAHFSEGCLHLFAKWFSAYFYLNKNYLKITSIKIFINLKIFNNCKNLMYIKSSFHLKGLFIW